MKTNRKDYFSELFDVMKLFNLGDEYVCTDELSGNNSEDIEVLHTWNGDGLHCKDELCLFGRTFSSEFDLPENADLLIEKKLIKRHSKSLVYNALKEITGRRLPWGSLTGIRPTKIWYEFEENREAPIKGLSEVFDVSERKITLLSDIVDMQRGLINRNDRAVDIYIGIPFCVTKCIYCSFTGGVIARIGKYVDEYVRTARRELENALEIINDGGLLLDNVYIGGGTPTAISAADLYEIIAPLKGVKIKEFTVEAGRPDTITTEHLVMFKDMGVKRVSVNPQTMNAEVLSKINRKHTPEDIIRTYHEVKSYGFCVNMDLIAGLPGENADMFKYSLDSCADLDPENITVHTLALKRGSTMKEENISAAPQSEAVEMVEYARDRLNQAGYRPYYLYRQKYMTGNLENVGYAKPNMQCHYNIDIMEECKSIIACGSNGISKRVSFNRNGNVSSAVIERFADTKDVKLYIERGDENWKGKKNFFCEEKLVK